MKIQAFKILIALAMYAVGFVTSEILSYQAGEILKEQGIEISPEGLRDNSAPGSPKH